MTTEARKEQVPVRRQRQSAAGNGLDSMAKSMIDMLQREGRMPNTAMAARLRVSEGTVRRRLHQLMESRALTVVAVPDWKALGYTTEAMVGLRVDLNQLDTVATKLASLPQVHSVMTVTGAFDIFIKVLATSTSDLARFLETNIASINGVRSAQTFIALAVNKREHQAWAS